MSAVFSLSQGITGVPLGRLSDHVGRKPVILGGVLVTMMTFILFSFSQSITWAIIARAIAGASSGTVGIIRTAVAEMVPEKMLQPKAFSIMPLVWSFGSILGPTLGGSLAKPATAYPQLFGDNEFLKRFPFALPNLVASALFVIGFSFGFLFLKAGPCCSLVPLSDSVRRRLWKRESINAIMVVFSERRL